MRNLCLTILLCLHYLILATAAFAQDPKDLKFDRYSTDQGLSQSNITAIVQDKMGFVWLGTTDGLNRFDGYNFTVFVNDPQVPTSISSNAIQALCIDRSGALWVGTQSGLCRTTDGGLSFERLKGEQNATLHNDNITAIFEEKSGNILIGTQGGLYKTGDGGKSFKQIGNDARKGASLVSDVITAITADNNGVLWVGTFGGGVAKSTDGGQTFTSFQHNPDDAKTISSDTITGIAVDKKNRVWITTFGGGLNGLYPNRKDFDRLRHSLNRSDDDMMTSICLANDENLWIGSVGRLWRYNPNSKKEPWRNYTVARGLSDNHITAVYQDKAGLIWAGTFGGGVNITDPYGSAKFDYVIVKRRNPRDDRFYNEDVSAVWEEGTDKDGYPILLVGTTSNGLFRVYKNILSRLPIEEAKAAAPAAGKGKKSKPVKRKAKPAKQGKKVEAKKSERTLSSNYVSVLLRDRSGVLWVGTDNGLNYYDTTNGRGFAVFKSTSDNPKSLNDNFITALCEDKSGNLWVGTKNGLHKLAKANRYDTTKGGQFALFKTASGLSSNDITVLFEDKSGALWIGTRDAGLCRTTDGGATFTKFTASPQGLTNNTITSICQDKKGAIWVSILGGGLCRTVDNGATFTPFRERDGLASDVVFGTVADEDGNLWLKTRKGITKFSPPNDVAAKDRKGGLFRNYDKRDGLLVRQFDAGGYHIGASGAIYFGGLGVVHTFYPEDLKDNDDAFVPPVVITGLTKFDGTQFTRDSSIIIKKDIELAPKDYLFTVEFSALSYYLQEKNQYQYKLEGFDKIWVDARKGQHEATYTNIEPGNYTFRVKAAGPDGVWNEEGASLTVNIVPPLWKRLWFQVLAFLSGVGLIVGLTSFTQQQRIKRIERQKEELEFQVQARTKDLAESNLKLEQTNKSLAESKKQLEESNQEILEKNREITSSIEYAKTIQLALLPSRDRLKRALLEYFILYRPKDIVSGDFYWLHETTDKVIFVVADCTGHGVPGAFMSMIGESLLGQLVIEKNISNPAHILNEMHKNVRQALNQTDEIGSGQDGMDMGVCVIYKSAELGGTKRVCYAGARRPLYYVNAGNGEFHEVKGDKFSIGGWQRESDRKYTAHDLNIEIGSMLYMTTDGYADQPDAQMRVFAAKRLREFLKNIALDKTERQFKLLESELEKHQGSEPQRDDITVVGIRVI